MLCIKHSQKCHFQYYNIQKQMQLSRVLLLMGIAFELAAFVTLNQSLPPLINVIGGQTVRKIDVFTNQRFISEFGRASVPVQLQQWCHLHDSHLNIQTAIQIQDSNSDAGPTPTFAYSKAHGILYKLSKQQITAYRINQTAAKKENSIQFQSPCSKSMILHGQYLYIYSCDGIYLVEVKQVLLDMTKLHSWPANREVSTLISIDDLILCVEGGQVRIYGVQMNNNLTEIGSISDYHKATLDIASLHYQKNKLYILDKTNGMYIFNRSALNAFSPQSQIKLSITHQDITYQHLQIENSSYYVSASYRVANKEHAFVCQFQVQGTAFYLVRYFKGYGYISHMQIIHDKLMLLSDKGVDLYDINLDPRMITSLAAPYSNSHVQGIRSMQKLSCSRHIIVGQKTISVAKIEIVEQKIECNFKQPRTYSYSHELGCNKIYGSYKNKPDAISADYLKFNVNCSQLQTVILNVTQEHKDPLIWMLFLTIGLAIVVVLLLMFWRQAKVQVIDKLALQIIRLKEHSHAHEVEFVENPNDQPNQQNKWKAFHDQVEPNDDNNSHKQEQIVSERSHLQEK